ncbi:Uu.00g072740.m01.CDS01 [Anthostomella pinea]|uniref:Uu.00g072740.m01.CDS01 n=1 Tax=Anthostomella pinea TaxID=933095 RepID=A0AAI8VV60_9PEZI|nr:Uu.00g072740.m01.CDS01 [Anthostomella pinea]
MVNAAEAPLLAHQEDDFDDELQPEAADAGRADNKQQQSGPIGTFVWLLTLSAYDTGVISATLVSVRTSLSGRELGSFDKSIITSCTALFALVASPLSSILADAFGRKPVILMADVLFIFGALVQALSYTVSNMVIGRSIVGWAIGAASFVTPLYIAELVPAAHRGRLVTLNVLSITMGQVVAYVVGWIFAEYGEPSMGWRFTVGLGAVPAVLQCVLVIFMPESPRWLVKAKKPVEARAVIQKTLGSDQASSHLVDDILESIEVEIIEEENSAKLNSRQRSSHSLLTGWDNLFNVPKNRRALTIACLLQGLQQLCGFNSLMYFSATIFSMLGFTAPTLTSLSVAATNFVFTVAALLLIDRIGRRRILLYSIPFMVIGLFLSAYGFRSTKIPPAEVKMSDSMRSGAFIILASIMIYVASYALGLGNVPWMQSELFPLSVRSLGSGVATATNWLANFVVGLTFLPLMDSLTPSWTFVLYGIICVAGWFGVWLIYPETVGLTLEEATGLLENGWGVR